MSKFSPDILHIDEEHYSLVTYQAMRISKELALKSLFFTWQNINKKYPFPFSCIEKYNFKYSSIAIAGNRDAKEILRLKGYAKDIVVIPQFGVDPKVFLKNDADERRRVFGFSSNHFVIGFLGRFVPEKGLLSLVRALPLIPERGILFLIGNGPLYAGILREARRLGVSERVVIAPAVPSGNVPEILNCCDCMVLPSLTRNNWKEQFGRVLVEAMSCEVPVIGSDSGEIPNVIGDAGLIFKEGDHIALAENISLLLNNGSVCAELGQKGRARVLNRFTQLRVAEDTFRVYKTLMSR